MLIEIVCWYAREDQSLMQSIRTHLMPLQYQGLISVWSDTDINAGTEREQAIEEHLSTAQIILLLISPDFIAAYGYSTQMGRVIQRHEEGNAYVIPILLRPSHWEDTPFRKLQVLPKDGKPVTKWATKDDAMFDIIKGISLICKELLENSNESSQSKKEQASNQKLTEVSQLKERKKQEHIEPSANEDNLNALLQQDLDTEGVEDIDQYIGSIKSLRSGSVHRELTDQLVNLGIKQKTGKQTSDADILERYRSVPLHAIFLYTWAHQDIASYISANWGDLDTLSGDVCDVHQSVNQFKDAETAYDYIEKLDVVKMANFKEYSQLPGVFFWDNQGAWEYIPFGSRRSDADITNIIQVVFEEIHKNPTTFSVTRAKKRLRKEGHLLMKERPTKKTANWSELLVILLAFVVVMSGIGLAAYFISPFVLWLVLIAGLLFLVLIILYLRGPAELSETSFVLILFRFFDALPLLRKGSNQEVSDRKSDKAK